MAMTRTAFAAAILAAGLVGVQVPAAHAYPGLDPHVPQPGAGYCPGGGDGGFQGFCDGVDFPDGTFVHTSRGFIPFKGWTNTMYCASTHDFIPEHAAPGGCAGLL